MRRLVAITLCASFLTIVLPPAINKADAQAQGVVRMDRVDYTQLETDPDPGYVAFAESLTRFGDFLLVGARNADGNDGAVYVFRVDPDGSLTYLSKLVDQENPNPFYFGQLVSGDQGWAGILDHGQDLQLFEQTGDDFVFRQAFSPETLGAVEMTGFDSLDMSGSTLMVGDTDAFVGKVRPGGVGVYELAGGTWALQSMIPNPLPGDVSSYRFGLALAVSGDLAVITDPGVMEGGVVTGRAYLYERTAGGTWQLRKELRPSVEDYGQRFARSVAVEGDTVIVACSTCNNEAGGNGSIYIYERNQGGTDNWGLAQEIADADGEFFPLLERPQALYLRGDVLAFGTGTNAVNKYLRVFTRPGAGMPFSQWAFIDESADGGLTSFGYAIDGSGTSLVVGAPNWPDDGNGLRQGAAYAYRMVMPCHGADTIYCDGFEGFQ